MIVLGSGMLILFFTQMIKNAFHERKVLGGLFIHTMYYIEKKAIFEMILWIFCGFQFEKHDRGTIVDLCLMYCDLKNFLL